MFPNLLFTIVTPMAGSFLVVGHMHTDDGGLVVMTTWADNGDTATLSYTNL